MIAVRRYDSTSPVGFWWSPQPGPQSHACTCPCDIIFFGGTRGGGKTDAAIGRQLYKAKVYGENHNGLMIRRKFKDFMELRRRIDQLIRYGLPAERIGGENQTNHINFDNGARIILDAVNRLEMADTYQGQQFAEITIDEGPTIPFIAQLIDRLKGANRSPAGVPCHIFVTGNPGGPGSSQIKTLFIEPGGIRVRPGTILEDHLEDGGVETRVFIKSTLDDNQILCQGDPKYVMRLRSIKNKALREAWLLGNWDVFIGQALDFRVDLHTCVPFAVPRYAPLYMTFDWGFGKPFSVGWWFTDADGRLYRFAEWYGWDGVTPDVGLRLEDSKIAQGIKEREEKLNIKDRQITRLADPTCWNKKPDFKGGGQGRATADVFADHGLQMIPGDPNRELKIRQFRERLVVPETAEGRPTEAPMIQVFDHCHHFIRTIPSLCLDDLRPEDIDTDQEDHIYDEASLIMMYRPLKMTSPDPVLTQAQEDWKVVLALGRDSASVPGAAAAFNLPDD